MKTFNNTWKRFLILLAALSLTAVSALAQHEHHASLSKPAELLPGLSGLNHPVTTKNAEAQKFFNQGLALIYGFNHEEAKRSFERATQLDPKLAMADIRGEGAAQTTRSTRATRARRGATGSETAGGTE